MTPSTDELTHDLIVYLAVEEQRLKVLKKDLQLLIQLVAEEEKDND